MENKKASKTLSDSDLQYYAICSSVNGAHIVPNDARIMHNEWEGM
jgi:hypothetical protein